MTNETLPRDVTPRELQLGDKVRVLLPDAPYGTATVVGVTNPVNNYDHGQVYFCRPYVMTSNFSTTGGVIPYIGTETFSVSRDSSNTFTLLERDNNIR